jgi:predicted DNA-binding transcriptional regulator YafY
MIWWLGDFIAQLERGGARKATRPDHKLPILSFDASDLAVIEAMLDTLHALNLVKDDEGMRKALKRGMAGVRGEPIPQEPKRWGGRS